MTSRDRELYLYALAEPGLPRRMRLLGRSLRTLEIGPVHAVVGSREQPARPDARALAEQHAIVVRLAARSAALLPARFGSVVSEVSLRAVLASHAAAIVQALTMVRGCDQMTIRVFGPPDASRPVEVRNAGGAAYLQSRRALARHVPAEAQTIRRALGSCVTAERVEPGASAIRLTVHHLVPKAAAARYQRRASALQDRLEPWRVTVTGPWPAFAFAPELL